MMAINAACCCAFAAMAARKVKTRLKLAPPKIVMPINANPFSNGLPNKTVNTAKLNKLISNINNRLNISFAKTKSLAPAME